MPLKYIARNKKGISFLAWATLAGLRESNKRSVREYPSWAVEAWMACEDPIQLRRA